MTRQVETPCAQSWRDIPQPVNPRTMTPRGLRRLGSNIVHMAFSLVFLGGAAGAAAWLWQGFDTPAKTLAPVVQAAPLRAVVVLSDGVIARDWVVERLALPQDVALVAVDLDAAKAALERDGQVRSAVVSRDFPDTLVVTIEERVPVARARAVLDPGAGPETLLVARDGTPYTGHGYDPAMVETLPWVDGVRLVRCGAGFERIEGMDRVSDLVLAVRQNAPHLAAGFRVVSLADLPRLVVRMPAVRAVVFDGGASANTFRQQLARLDYILDEHRRQENAPAIERLDLSIAAQVIVEYARPAGPAAAFSQPNPNSPNRNNNRGFQR
jgi:cell division protein FtsQ